MHFGRVKVDRELDLSLPSMGARSKGYLNLGHGGRGLIYCGAPIWACKDWEDSVYPPGTRPSQYLRYYAERFPMIELNSSFYRIPTLDQVRLWCREVGPEFRFLPKVPKALSHELARFDPRQLHDFLRCVEEFGANLGLPFMQLPEWFELKDFPWLEKFLGQWPEALPLALEFRHPSWFKDHMLLDPVINFLYRRQLATVITDTPGQREVLHMALTYPSVLLRFMGVFPSRQDQSRLKAWLDRLEDWAHQGMDAIYIAIHQERNGSIPMTVDFAQRYLYEKKFEGLVKARSENKAIRGHDDDHSEVEDLILG